MVEFEFRRRAAARLEAHAPWASDHDGRREFRDGWHGGLCIGRQWAAEDDERRARDIERERQADAPGVALEVEHRRNLAGDRVPDFRRALASAEVRREVERLAALVRDEVEVALVRRAVEAIDFRLVTVRCEGSIRE